MKARSTLLYVVSFALIGSLSQAQTQNYVAKFGSTGNVINSSLFDNGNIGIGTTSPDGKLNITGATNNWTANGWSKGIRLEGIHAIEFGGGEILKYGIGYSDSTLFFFDTTSENNSAPANYRMVLYNGNLGVGIHTPSQRLEVNGSLKLTPGGGGGVIFADGTTQGTAWNGVASGTGLTNCGFACLAVDGTVSRNNTANTFTASQTFNGNVTVQGAVHGSNLVAAIHGSCITASFSTPFVLNGLGQAKTTDCTFGPGSPTFNPSLGSVIPFSGTLKALQVVQTSLGGSNFGGTVQVYVEPFNPANGTWTSVSLSCTLGTQTSVPLNQSTSCSDMSNTVAVTAGQKIMVVVTPPSGFSTVAPTSAVMQIVF